MQSRLVFFQLIFLKTIYFVNVPENSKKGQKKDWPKSQLIEGPLKKWWEQSQELHLLKIHSRGRAPITLEGVDFLDHELLLSQKLHIKIFLMSGQKSF